jgi:hypothetical protein
MSNILRLTSLILLAATSAIGAAEPSKAPHPSSQPPAPRLAIGAAEPSKASRPLCIVITGESNAGGFGLNKSATAAELALRPCVQIMNLTSGKYEFEDLRIGVNNLRKHRMLESRETSCHGFELELANVVAEGALPGYRQVYLIKTGQGGSVLANWKEDQPDWKDNFLPRIEAGRKQLPADVQWVVWLSLGINDARRKTPNCMTAPIWKTEMSCFIDRLQKELPKAVIVMTGFQSMGYAEFNQAIAELAAEKKGVFAIDSTGASKADGNHWNYAGLKLITGRLIGATLEGLKGTGGDGNGATAGGAGK